MIGAADVDRWSRAERWKATAEAETERGNELAEEVRRLTNALADMTAQRDAAAENARRERDRPRCRVVTSPRFYDDEQRDRAAYAMFSRPIIGFNLEHEKSRVDVIAEALGMRRVPR